MGLPDRFEFGQPVLETVGVFELLIQLEVGPHGGAGDADGEGDLESLEPHAGQEDDAGEVLQVALNGTQGVVDGAGNFLRLLAFEPVAHGLALVGDGRADVFLLATGGNDDAAGLEGSDVAADGAHVATEQPGQVLLGEQTALFFGLLGQTGQLVLAELNEVALGLRIVPVDQAQDDADQCILLQRLAGPFAGPKALVADLAAFEWARTGLPEVDWLQPGAHRTNDRIVSRRYGRPEVCAKKNWRAPAVLLPCAARWTQLCQSTL